MLDVIKSQSCTKATGPLDRLLTLHQRQAPADLYGGLKQYCRPVLKSSLSMHAYIHTVRMCVSKWTLILMCVIFMHVCIKG